MRQVSKQHNFKAFECPLALLPACVLFCHAGHLSKNYADIMEGFGGSLINVFTLSKLIGKEYAGSCPREPPLPFSPLGTTDLSCLSLLAAP